jgi:hypothetical protein
MIVLLLTETRVPILLSQDVLITRSCTIYSADAEDETALCSVTDTLQDQHYITPKLTVAWQRNVNDVRERAYIAAA